MSEEEVLQEINLNDSLVKYFKDKKIKNKIFIKNKLMNIII